mmetsp:Transcript_5087/g.15057  ORF Transcript_5087/g.15057 Transcript_5087/m.15057 type:complete len:229 (+) Transcript_5087:1096-1782(+)
MTAGHEWLAKNFGVRFLTFTLANLRNCQPLAMETFADRDLCASWANEIPVEEVHWVLRVLMASSGFNLMGRGHTEFLRTILMRMDFIKREFPDMSEKLGANVAYERMFRRLLANHKARQERYLIQITATTAALGAWNTMLLHCTVLNTRNELDEQHPASVDHDDMEPKLGPHGRVGPPVVRDHARGRDLSSGPGRAGAVRPAHLRPPLRFPTRRPHLVPLRGLRAARL